MESNQLRTRDDSPSFFIIQGILPLLDKCLYVMLITT
jgi:hypothetical protein